MRVKAGPAHKETNAAFKSGSLEEIALTCLVSETWDSAAPLRMKMFTPKIQRRVPQ
jgi:hypothetical protein